MGKADLRRRIGAVAMAVGMVAGFFSGRSVNAGADSGITVPDIVVIGDDGKLPDGGLADYSVPVGTVRWVYPPDKDRVPAPVAHFWESVGEVWRTYWNVELETPALTFPPRRTVIVESAIFTSASVDEAALLQALLDFVDAHTVFFGVGRSELGIPEVFPLGESWLVVLRQLDAASGLTIRGAGLRASIRNDGSLEWIKAHLVRELPTPPGLGAEDSLLDQVAIEKLVALWAGEVEHARLEIAFPDGTLTSARPLWSVGVRDADGWETATMIDAVYGGVLLRLREVVVPTESSAEEIDTAEVATGVDPVTPPDGTGDGAGGAQPLPAQSVLVIGVAEGVRPDDALERTRYVHSKLFSAAVREIHEEAGTRREQVVAVVSEGGVFLGRTRAAMPTLSISLEGRRCTQVDPTACFVAETPETAPELPLRFRIRPAVSAAQTGLGTLPLGSFDSNQDTVPDVEVVFDPAGTGLLEFDVEVEPENPPLDTDAFRALWVDSYVATEASLRFAERTIAAAGLQTLLPLTALDVHPLPSGMEFLGRYYKGTTYPVPAVMIPQRLPHLRVRVVEDALKFEPLTTSVIHRQVGVHLFFELTGTRATDPAHHSDIRDGILDALGAMAYNRSEVGFRADGTPTSRAFLIDQRQTDRFLHPRLRQNVRRALFGMHAETLVSRAAGRGQEPSELTEGGTIIYRWLGSQHLDPQLPPVRTFACGPTYLDELLLADEGVYGDGDPQTEPPHRGLVEDSLRGGPFFEAPFLRGDASGDGLLNITDAFALINFLFVNAVSVHDCWNALDADNSSQLDLADVLKLVNYLFRNGPPLGGRMGECALDTDAPCHPANLGCEVSSCAAG